VNRPVRIRVVPLHGQPPHEAPSVRAGQFTDFGEWCESVGGKYTEYLSGQKECEVDVYSLKDLNKTILRDAMEDMLVFE